MAPWISQKHRTAPQQATASFCHLSQAPGNLGSLHGPETTSFTPDPSSSRPQPGLHRLAAYGNSKNPIIRFLGQEQKAVPSRLSLALDRSQPSPGPGRHWGECWRDGLDGQAVAHTPAHHSSQQRVLHLIKMSRVGTIKARTTNQ